MLTTKIINAAEKVQPFEKKLDTFFSKKAPRLVTLGTITVVSSVVYWNIPRFSSVLWEILLICLAITAGAGFFSSIKRFTVTKFIIADVAVTAAHLLGLYLSTIRFIDPGISNVYQKMAAVIWEHSKFTYIPALC